MENAPIYLTYPKGKGNETWEGLTNSTGQASIPLILKKRPKNGELRINITYPGMGYHLGSHVMDSITVVKRGFPLIWLLGLLTVSGALGLLYLNRDKLPRDIWEKASKQIPSLKSGEKREAILIDFPQIESPLPNVWGRDEDLVIRIRVKEGVDLVDNLVHLNIDGEETILSLVDNLAELKWRFKEKGEYKMKALAYLPQNVTLEGYKEIRIVDYREEIIRLFNMEFNLVRGDLDKLEIHFTARDFQRMLKDHLPPGAGTPLERMINLFEEADYSIHDINRGAYTDYYQAYGRYKEHVGEEGV
jgi:hypothetical protein